VAFYLSKFVTKVKLTELMATFNFYPDGLLLCSLRNKIYSSSGKENGVFIYAYEYIRDFDIFFPFSNFKSGLLSALSRALSQLYCNSWCFCEIIRDCL